MPKQVVLKRELLPLHWDRAAAAHEAQHPGVKVLAVTFETDEAVTPAEEADELLTLGGNSARTQEDGKDPSGAWRRVLQEHF